MRERRLARVELDFELLSGFIIAGRKFEGNLIVTKGIPEDAVYINSYTDDRTMKTCFLFYHESFPEVPDGGVIPLIEIHWSIITLSYDNKVL